MTKARTMCAGIKRQKEKLRTFVLSSLCWHYLFSRPVTRQLSSAHVSLTSVFGMGTGGPSQQSIPTLTGRLFTFLYIKLRSMPFCYQALSFACLLGDPYRIRTDVNGVRGRCLNHLTNGPAGPPSGTRTRDPLIKSQLLYQLS